MQFYPQPATEPGSFRLQQIIVRAKFERLHRELIERGRKDDSGKRVEFHEC